MGNDEANPDCHLGSISLIQLLHSTSLLHTVCLILEL